MSSLQRLVLLPALLAGLASVSQAQSFETSRTCFRPGPAPACDNFVITEVGYYPLMGSTTASAFFGGVRLGSYPALIAPVVVYLRCMLVPYGCM